LMTTTTVPMCSSGGVTCDVRATDGSYVRTECCSVGEICGYYTLHPASRFCCTPGLNATCGVVPTTSTSTTTSTTSTTTTTTDPYVPGCTGIVAMNYNPLATDDDGTCLHYETNPTPTPGCTDSTATNYLPEATVGDGTCVFEPSPTSSESP
jgi:hypothetical protein